MSATISNLYKMDEIDHKILKAIKDGLPLIEDPYGEVAARVGVNRYELLERLTKMKDEGIIRRFAASIDQHKLGIKANAVVAWKVPSEAVESMARKLVESGLFSHCYERGGVPGVWEYNLYAVIHGRDRDSVTTSVSALSDELGMEEYGIFFSVRGFKRFG